MAKAKPTGNVEGREAPLPALPVAPQMPVSSLDIISKVKIVEQHKLAHRNKVVLPVAQEFGAWFDAMSRSGYTLDNLARLLGLNRALIGKLSCMFDRLKKGKKVAMPGWDKLKEAANQMGISLQELKPSVVDQEAIRFCIADAARERARVDCFFGKFVPTPEDLDFVLSQVMGRLGVEEQILADGGTLLAWVVAESKRLTSSHPDCPSNQLPNLLLLVADGCACRVRVEGFICRLVLKAQAIKDRCQDDADLDIVADAIDLAQNIATMCELLKAFDVAGCEDLKAVAIELGSGDEETVRTQCRRLGLEPKHFGRCRNNPGPLLMNSHRLYSKATQVFDHYAKISHSAQEAVK